MKVSLLRTHTTRKQALEIKIMKTIEATRLGIVKSIADIVQQASLLEQSPELADKILAYHNLAHLVAELNKQQLQLETQLQPIKKTLRSLRPSEECKTAVTAAENLCQRLNNNVRQNIHKFPHTYETQSYVHHQKYNMPVSTLPLAAQFEHFFGMYEIKQTTKALQQQLFQSLATPQEQFLFLFPEWADVIEPVSANQVVKLFSAIVNGYSEKLVQHPGNNSKRQQIVNFLGKVDGLLANLENNRVLFCGSNNHLFTSVFGNRYARRFETEQLAGYISRLSYLELAEKGEVLSARLALLTTLLTDVNTMAQAKNDFLHSNDKKPFSDIFTAELTLNGAQPTSVMAMIKAEIAATHEMQAMVNSWLQQQVHTHYNSLPNLIGDLNNLAADIESYRQIADPALAGQIEEQIASLNMVFEIIGFAGLNFQKGLLDSHAANFYRLQRQVQESAINEQQFDNLLEKFTHLQTSIKYYSNTPAVAKVELNKLIESLFQDINTGIAGLQNRYTDQAGLAEFQSNVINTRIHFNHLQEAKVVDQHMQQLAKRIEQGQGFFAVKSEKQAHHRRQQTVLAESTDKDSLDLVIHQRANAVLSY